MESQMSRILMQLEDERGALTQRLQKVNHRIAVLREAQRICAEAETGGMELENLRVRYEKLTQKDMLMAFCRDLGGTLNTSEDFGKLVEAGLFRDQKAASSSLHPILSKHPDLFRKLGRGHYVLQDREVEAGPTHEQQTLQLAEPDDDFVADLAALAVDTTDNL